MIFHKTFDGKIKEKLNSADIFKQVEKSIWIDSEIQDSCRVRLLVFIFKSCLFIFKLSIYFQVVYFFPGL